MALTTTGNPRIAPPLQPGGGEGGAAPAGAFVGRPRPRARGLAHGLVDDLGQKVRDGVLRPGNKLPTESEIMKAYGVSRTVVREALSKLQAAGLVETHHGPRRSG